MTSIDDRELFKPIFTPENARAAGFSEEEIARIFGKTDEKQAKSNQFLSAIAKAIHYVTLRR